jgi:hypothetical protein
MKEELAISRALILWSGWGRCSSPQRDESRLLERFSLEQARELLPKVRELEAEFYSSDAFYKAKDLAEMAETASAEFRSKPNCPKTQSKR